MTGLIEGEESMARTRIRCSRRGCEAEMDLVTRTDDLVFADVPFRVTWTIWECPRDGSTIVPVDVHRIYDQNVLRTIATRGPATSRTFRALRDSLNLSGIELANLLDVTPETVSRWETGKKPLNPLAWVVVASMALDKLEGRAVMRRQLLATAVDGASRSVSEFTIVTTFTITAPGEPDRDG